MTTLRGPARERLYWGVATLMLGAGLVLALWQREPQFQGKPFSFWVAQLPATLAWTNVPYSVFSRGSYNQFLRNLDAADNAVDALGPGCLETLVRRLGTRETVSSRIKSALKAEGVRRGWFKPDWHIEAAWFKRGQAITALSRLGPAAEPVVPQILTLAESDRDPGVRRDALEVLRRIAPTAYAQGLAERTAFGPARP
jgi:hypothetical protein